MAGPCCRVMSRPRPARSRRWTLRWASSGAPAVCLRGSSWRRWPSRSRWARVVWTISQRPEPTRPRSRRPQHPRPGRPPPPLLRGPAPSAGRAGGRSDLRPRPCDRVRPRVPGRRRDRAAHAGHQPRRDPGPACRPRRRPAPGTRRVGTTAVTAKDTDDRRDLDGDSRFHHVGRARWHRRAAPAAVAGTGAAGQEVRHDYRRHRPRASTPDGQCSPAAPQ